MTSSNNRGTFSLSKPSNESPREQSPPNLASKFVNFNNINSLGFLLQAANNNNNNKMGPGDQQSGKPSSSGSKPDGGMDQQARELQQALQMSMASQNQQAAHPSALFATNRSVANSAPTAAQTTAQLVSQLQAQQLLAGGQVGQQVFAPQAPLAGAPIGGNMSQGPSNQGNNNANVINQLVASLQAQQQAQQQVQVQAAIARAFGPGGGGGGLSTGGFNAAPLGNLAGISTSISQPSARDILSRMQLVQAAQQDNNNKNVAAAVANNGNGNDDLAKLQQAQQSVSINEQLNGLKSVGLLNQQVANALSNNVITGLNNSGGGQSQGAVIVPCRARGMPVDHNFKTAYFVIPDGVEHGDELVCSYPACRQAGVKFRYCLHCKVPVAKRNFRNRHRHGVPGGDGGSDTADDESVGSAEMCTIIKNDGKVAANGEASKNDDVDYKNVKREHLVIIPGANTTLDEKKKKKKKRVPCRARGMPMAHNFKTAYFNIPDNIQHGDELECSFPACRSAGAKFRYCLYCKIPVAKRNFRNRHKHGNGSNGDKKRSPSGNAKDSGNGSPPALPKGEDVCLPTNDSQKGDDKEAASSNVEDEGDLKPSSLPPSDPEAATKNDDEPAQSVSVSTGEDASKVQSWVSLLENKPDPNDKEAMTDWMMKVMNASGGGNAAAPAASVSESEPSQPPKKKFKDDSL